MSKSKFTNLLIILTFAGVNNSIAADTVSDQAIKDSGKASGHASGSAAHSIAASGRVTSAVVAVPLSVGGAALSVAGGTSIVVANGSMKAATAPIGTPLEVTKETITVMPPNVALKAKDRQ